MWTNEFYWGYIQEFRREVTYRNTNDSKTGILLWVATYKIWVALACYIVCRQFNRLESVLSKCLSWPKLLPGSSTGFCFFQAAGKVSQTLLHLGFSETDSQQYLLLSLGREGPSESCKFQELPEAILCCLPSVVRWNVFNLGGNYYTFFCKP